MRRTDRYRILVVLAVLVVLHFSIRARLGDERVAPDFLLLALLLYTIRAQPGRAAVAGFVVGLLRDALSPASFGAGALAHTLVGYFSASAKSVFFAENVFVNAWIIFVATWVRNLIVGLASGQLAGSKLGWELLGWELLVWSPLQSFTTAAAGVLVLVLLGRWMVVRVSRA